MSERLHGRQVIFQVGISGTPGLAIEGLPISFDCSFKLDGKPNQGSFGIRGASRDLYARCAEPGARIRLLAGYSLPKLIFSGDPLPRVGVSFRHDSGSRLLEVQALDGGNTLANSYLDLSFDGQTTVGQVITEAVRQLGIAVGPVAPDIAAIVMAAGFRHSGSVSKALDRLAVIAGFGWSVTDGALEIRPDVGDTSVPATVLSTTTGNLLSLEPKKDGTIEFHALLDGSIRPGRRVAFDHPDFSGVAKCRDVRFVGDPGWDVPFYTDGTARPE